MKRSIKILLFSIIYLFLVSHVHANAEELFNRGKTNYRIVLSSNASKTEETAANELATYLKQISGTTFEINGTPGERNIYVGYDSANKVFKRLTAYKNDDDGFMVMTIGSDIVIFGGKERGTMYGVYRFLETLFGVEWYTPTFTKVPKLTTYSFKKIEFSEHPKIFYRYTDFYCVNDDAWLAHNLMNNKYRKSTPNTNKYGIQRCLWSQHTMKILLPSKSNFDKHPEYFALYKGKRIKDGQLCLSNPKVIDILTKEILKVIENHPEFDIYDVSQNDNNYFCQCENCKAVEAKYGGKSGLILWAVNQVANEVKKSFPDKYITTLAYKLTRSAPVGIAPADNVVIRLCDIECCFAHSLSADNSSRNTSFIKDLKDWSRIAKHIFIWDYAENWRGFMTPYPNINALGSNIQTFMKYKVMGVFEGGQNLSYGSDFEELKSWLIGKLLWNPYQNTEFLARQFIKDYYGSSSQEILQYYNLYNSLVKPDVHIGCRLKNESEFYNDDFVKKAYPIMERAEKAASDSVILERVKKVKLQVLASEYALHPQNFYKSGKWLEFKTLVLKYNAYIKLGVGPEKFIPEFESVVKKRNGI